jgi:signal transduction histidine kinase/CheY-like chemotaxis protein
MDQPQTLARESYYDRWELRATAMLALATGLLPVVWIWATYLFFALGGFGWGIIPPFVLALALLPALAWRNTQPQLAAGLMVGGLLLTGVLAVALHGLAYAPYMAMLVTAFVSVLLDPLPLLAFTVAFAGCLIGVGVRVYGLRPLAPELLYPLLGLLLMALASWITSRSLFTALSWAWESYAQARNENEHRRRQQGRLRQALRSMDEASYRLQRMNYELARARDAATELQVIKQQFAANVSHELRTPLALVAGFAEMIYLSPASYGEPLPHPYLADIREIYLNSRHLLGLVDDILDLSRFNIGKMLIVRQEASPADIVHETASMMRSLIEGKGLAFEVQIDEPLPAANLDAARTRQVLINLLNNARRFTEQGAVRLHVWAQEGSLCLDVSDTGIGILSDDQQKLFEAFHQLDGSLARQHDGTGLGLAISKEIVEMHGGHISVSSEGVPGRGSTFRVMLPLGLTEEAARTRQSLHTPSRAPSEPMPTMLLVSEDESLKRLMERRLADYRWVQVSDPSQVGATARRLAPQAAVLALTSIDPRDQIREFAAFADCELPMIACPLGSEARLARYLGVNSYLVKPISRDALLGALSGLGEQVRKVLIVDDDTRVVALLARMIQSATQPYQVLRAYSGQDGLTRLAREGADVVVLDLVMPNLDGTQFLERMRAEARFAHTPVIVVTSKGLDLGDGRYLGGRFMGVNYPIGISDDQLLEHLQAFLAVMGQTVSAAASLPPASPPPEVQPDEASEGSRTLQPHQAAGGAAGQA